MAQSFLKAPTIERLPNLLEQLRSGEIRIPPFQRDFVWSGEQRLELLDSVRKGLPSGSLMVWRTLKRLKTPSPVGPFDLRLPEVPMATTQTYLLDGMQRMTTLFAALGAGLYTREGLSPPLWTGTDGLHAPDGTPWAVAFDVSSAEGSFSHVTGDDDSAGSTHWLPLAILLDDALFDEWREQAKANREVANRARALRSAFVDYMIPVVPLATDELGPVTMTFKRLNQGGTRMGDFHMARALSFAEDFDLEQTLDEDVVGRLTPLGWESVDRDQLLKVVAAGYGLEPVEVDSERLAALIGKNRATMTAVGAAAVWAATFLETLGFGGPAVLPSGYMLVFAARVHLECHGSVSETQLSTLRSWMADAAISERFAGGIASHIIVATWRELARGLGIPVQAREVGRKVKPARVIRAPGGRVNFGWARPKVTAAVLALRCPRLADGQPMDAPVRQLGEQGRGVFLPLLDAEQTRGLDRDLALGTANHVICPAASISALRLRVRTADCPAEIFTSHLVTREAHEALVRGDFATFLHSRLRAIHTAEQAWLAAMGSAVELPPIPLR
ncbi:DUF262 domain-containing protein [Myxococcota bacterium]|nr:DUF262 domain-containing protein [Myxococcota bacterium]